MRSRHHSVDQLAAFRQLMQGRVQLAKVLATEAGSSRRRRRLTRRGRNGIRRRIGWIGRGNTVDGAIGRVDAGNRRAGERRFGTSFVVPVPAGPTDEGGQAAAPTPPPL